MKYKTFKEFWEEYKLEDHEFATKLGWDARDGEIIQLKQQIIILRSSLKQEKKVTKMFAEQSSKYFWFIDDKNLWDEFKKKGKDE